MTSTFCLHISTPVQEYFIIKRAPSLFKQSGTHDGMFALTPEVQHETGTLVHFLTNKCLMTRISWVKWWSSRTNIRSWRSQPLLESCCTQCRPLQRNAQMTSCTLQHDMQHTLHGQSTNTTSSVDRCAHSMNQLYCIRMQAV